MRILFNGINSEIDNTWNELEQIAKSKKVSLVDVLKLHANDKMYTNDALAYYEALKERSIEERTDSLLLDELKSIISNIENYG